MLTVICTQNFSILNLYRKSQFDENWMQKQDNFSVYRSQRTNVRIEKSNAWIINCELCTIDLTVWGLALIFDFLIILFCSVSTGRIQIFTQVRWSLQLNVNTTTLIDCLFFNCKPTHWRFSDIMMHSHYLTKYWLFVYN